MKIKLTIPKTVIPTIGYHTVTGEEPIDNSQLERPVLITKDKDDDYWITPLYQDSAGPFKTFNIREYYFCPIGTKIKLTI